MFDKQKYINSYVRNNYRTVKVRLRNDDSLLIDKLEKTENINKYIKDLIMDDILKHAKFNYINDEVKIDFEVSNKLKLMMRDAEIADLMDNYGIYMNIADAIDVQAKRETTRHLMKESDWNKLNRRYTL